MVLAFFFFVLISRHPLPVSTVVNTGYKLNTEGTKIVDLSQDANPGNSQSTYLYTPPPGTPNPAAKGPYPLLGVVTHPTEETVMYVLGANHMWEVKSPVKMASSKNAVIQRMTEQSYNNVNPAPKLYLDGPPTTYVNGSDTDDVISRAASLGMVKFTGASSLSIGYKGFLYVTDVATLWKIELKSRVISTVPGSFSVWSVLFGKMWKDTSQQAWIGSRVYFADAATNKVYRVSVLFEPDAMMTEFASIALPTVGGPFSTPGAAAYRSRLYFSTMVAGIISYSSSSIKGSMFVPIVTYAGKQYSKITIDPWRRRFFVIETTRTTERVAWTNLYDINSQGKHFYPLDGVRYVNEITHLHLTASIAYVTSRDVTTTERHAGVWMSLLDESEIVIPLPTQHVDGSTATFVKSASNTRMRKRISPSLTPTITPADTRTRTIQMKETTPTQGFGSYTEGRKDNSKTLTGTYSPPSGNVLISKDTSRSTSLTVSSTAPRSRNTITPTFSDSVLNPSKTASCTHGLQNTYVTPIRLKARDIAWGNTASRTLTFLLSGCTWWTGLGSIARDLRLLLTCVNNTSPRRECALNRFRLAMYPDESFTTSSGSEDVRSAILYVTIKDTPAFDAAFEEHWTLVIPKTAMGIQTFYNPKLVLKITILPLDAVQEVMENGKTISTIASVVTVIVTALGAHPTQAFHMQAIVVLNSAQCSRQSQTYVSFSSTFVLFPMASSSPENSIFTSRVENISIASLCGGLTLLGLIGCVLGVMSYVIQKTPNGAFVTFSALSFLPLAAYTYVYLGMMFYAWQALVTRTAAEIKFVGLIVIGILGLTPIVILYRYYHKVTKNPRRLLLFYRFYEYSPHPLFVYDGTWLPDSNIWRFGAIISEYSNIAPMPCIFQHFIASFAVASIMSVDTQRAYECLGVYVGAAFVLLIHAAIHVVFTVRRSRILNYVTCVQSILLAVYSILCGALQLNPPESLEPAVLNYGMALNVIFTVTNVFVLITFVWERWSIRRQFVEIEEDLPKGKLSGGVAEEEDEDTEMEHKAKFEALLSKLEAEEDEKGTGEEDTDFNPSSVYVPPENTTRPWRGTYVDYGVNMTRQGFVLKTV